MRAAAAGVALGLALAIGAPTAWALTGPSATAGAPVEEALEAPPAPHRLPAAPAVTRPRVATRDAAPRSSADTPAPVLVTFPALRIAAPVDPVGVSPDGQMVLPEDVDRVGWYRFGPAPGGAGSSVIAGHVDDRDQGLGVLAPLREVAVGDSVQVRDTAGTTTRWRVVSRQLVSKQALPLAALFRRDGPPRLVLLTCGGEFVSELSSYQDNVVVVAEPLP